MQIYAPTSTHPEEEIDDFYDQLQSLLERIPSREAVIILGDLNSKVGECTDKEHGIGPYGLGTRNARGEKLADFCQANDLVVTNQVPTHVFTTQNANVIHGYHHRETHETK